MEMKTTSAGTEQAEGSRLSRSRLSTGDERPEARPWASAEEARGWKPLGRVRTEPGRLSRMTVVLDLDDEQSDWMRQETRRLGLSPVDLLRQLVDRYRQDGGGRT